MSFFDSVTGAFGVDNYLNCACNIVDGIADGKMDQILESGASLALSVSASYVTGGMAGGLVQSTVGSAVSSGSLLGCYCNSPAVRDELMASNSIFATLKQFLPFGEDILKLDFSQLNASILMGNSAQSQGIFSQILDKAEALTKIPFSGQSAGDLNTQLNQFFAEQASEQLRKDKDREGEYAKGTSGSGRSGGGVSILEVAAVLAKVTDETFEQAITEAKKLDKESSPGDSLEVQGFFQLASTVSNAAIESVKNTGNAAKQNARTT